MPAAYAPRDRTRREHVAIVKEHKWADRDRPVTILLTRCGASVIVDAHPDAVPPGAKVRFLGCWQEGKFGTEFRATTFVLDTPAGRAGVVSYLTKHCDGIGEKAADRLWLEFGAEAVKVLRTAPDRVAAAGVIAEEVARAAAADLQHHAALEATKVDLFELLDGRGFPRKTADLAVAKWGAAAPAVIRASPYRLMTAGIPGCGFRRCDALYLKLGGRPDALKRQACAAANALREDRTGSTWVDANTVAAAVRDSVPTATDPVKAIKLGTRAGMLRVRRDGDRRWVAFADHARAEQRIADAVARLRKTATPWVTDLPVSVEDGDGLPSAHQAEQATRAAAGAVGALTGGPGTGKTHVLSYILRGVLAAHGRDAVAVCAPTGKAGVRATASLAARGVHVRATTIHRLLGYTGQGFGFNRGNPLPCRFLVVDEASMIDASLMADLLEACPDGCRVLLVGDPFQLPPVGHGAPLRDLLAAGVDHGELTEVRRNAGSIVRACAAIKAGHPAEFVARLALDDADPANLKFVECPAAETLDVIEDTLRGMKKFDPAWDTQVIVATNEKSEVSRVAVNERFRRVLNPAGRTVAGIPFAVGDKVICLKNSRLTPCRAIGTPADPRQIEDAGFYQRDQNDETFVANGEVGRVQAVGTGGMVVAFDDRLVYVPKGRPKAETPDDGGDKPAAGGAMGDFDLAWAITGHKSQGSEYPLAIVIADRAGGGVADRHWWYTTLSRASRACLVVGDRAAFEVQVRRQSLARRKTFLVELLTPAAARAAGDTGE